MTYLREGDGCDCWLCQRERSGLPAWQGKYSRAALRALCERLGVAEGVRIRRAHPGFPDPALAAQGWRMPSQPDNAFIAAAHAQDKRDGTHIIDINPALTCEQANEALIHELTHAAQSERMGLRRFQDDYDRAERELGYAGNPYEREALDNQRDLTGEFVVVVA